MSLCFCVLASGSKGNATYVANRRGAVLVDCGLSGAELQRRLDAAGLDAHSIRAIVLTHEHRDHASGVGIMARRLRVPLFTTPATWRACPGTKQVRFSAMTPGQGFELAGMEITPFILPHDAVEAVGLVIRAGTSRLGICTDLGQATRLAAARLAGCRALILESNHDPRLLAQGPYPVWLKQRVRSRQGHLSNQQSARLLESLLHPGLEHVVLAHLSETNNTPELARRACQPVLGRSRTRLHLACQGHPTPVLEI